VPHIKNEWSNLLVGLRIKQKVLQWPGKMWGIFFFDSARSAGPVPHRWCTFLFVGRFIEICFDDSWTLTFLPFHKLHVSTAKELDECAPRTQQLMATSKKRRTLQPCPRVVQVKVNMPTNNWITFSPVPPRNFLRKDFFKEIFSQKKSWKLFVGLNILNSHKWFVVHRHSVILIFRSRQFLRGVANPNLSGFHAPRW